MLLHHPPYSSASLHGSESVMQWPFEAWGADAVLAAHDHTYERLIVGGFPYFVNGLGGNPSRYGLGEPLPESQSFYNDDYGAMVAQVCDARIEFEFHSLSEGVIDSYALGATDCSGAIPINQAPVVYAGPDQLIIWPEDSVTLDGSVIDDGIPTPPSITTFWSQLSGPGTVTFADATAVTTTATFSSPGAYTLELLADDGEQTGHRSVMITVVDLTIGVSDARVTASHDDAEERANGSVSLSSSDLEMVFDGSAQTVGMRFADVWVPPGAAITNAYVEFEVDEVSTIATSLVISGHSADDAPAFDGVVNDISARPLTAAQVAWDPPAWNTTGAKQASPNLTPIVQEIVDRPGWTAGNALVMIVTGTGKRVAEAYDGAPSAAPLLHIEYTPSLPVVTVAAADALASEGGADGGEFVVSRSGPTVGALTVGYSVGGSATAGSDYVALSGSVTIPVGQVSASVSVGVLDDSEVESDETVIVTVGADPSYEVGAVFEATVTIVDDDDVPVVSVTASDAVAGEPVDGGEFVVSRSGPTVGALTVGYSVGGSATAGSDYVALSGSVTIPVGQVSASVSVGVLDDSEVESDETVIVTVGADPSYEVGAVFEATVTIVDDDDGVPVVSVTASDAVAGEPADGGEFVVSRSGPTVGALTVGYSVGGSATAGSDYVALSGSVTIPVGQVSASVSVGVLDDSEVESDETVIVTVGADPSYEVGAVFEATVTIVDDDDGVPVVSVTASDAVAGEPVDGGEFVVSRSGPTVGALTVGYSVGGSATAGSDYVALSGSVTIPVGQVSASVSVGVLDDSEVESDETVIVTVGADPSYEVGAVFEATVTIVDDDDDVPVVSVTASDAVAGEPVDGGEFVVSRSGPTVGALTVGYSVGGSATAGSDYVALSGSVTIPVGQVSASVSVGVLDDSEVESDETVTVAVLSGPGYAIGSPDAAVVTIGDDDVVSVVFEVRVGSGSDDAEESSGGSVSLNSSDLELVHDRGGDQTVGLRFAGVAVPRGATVTAAWVEFRVDEVNTGVTDLTIRGQAADDAVSFVKVAGDITGRVVTAASVSWSPPVWGTVGEAGLAQRTPDLSAVIQEVVGRAGWVDGNAVVVVIGGSGERTAESYDGFAAAAPLLHIEYTTGPVANRPPVAIDDSADTEQDAAVLIDVLANDIDPDENLDPSTITALCVGCAGPSNGTLTNHLDGTFTYAPNVAFVGVDMFAYQVCDLEGVCDAATVTVTVVDPNVSVVFEVRVGSGSDDAEESSGGSVSLSSSDLELVHDRGGDQTVGLRFAGVAVPRGATVTAAWVEFRVDEVNTGVTDLTIRGQAADDAVSFVKVAGDITGRVVTAASVSWSPPVWGTVGEAGLAQRTPDLSAVIQEVVGRAGWVDGNAVVVVIGGSGERTAESYDGFAAAAPLLHIEYTTGS